ncbi:MAG: hypothetical protein IPJ40_23450 [Saprospirales bacterium]|nr:hypothetical protein [Saprospirales bacterium]
MKKGSPVDAGQYDKETSRIVTFLRNRGYAYFSSNYIASLEADSSNFKVQLILEVLLPPLIRFTGHTPSATCSCILNLTFLPTPSGIDTIAPGIYFMGIRAITRFGKKYCSTPYT